MKTNDRAFRPTFCPRPSCPNHTEPTGWRYKKDGFHWRQASPRRVQRYRCLTCNRSFSSQTFSTTYWLKRPDLLSGTFHQILACSAYRQIARGLGVSHTTIVHLAARLGRHCLLFQQLFRPRACLQEPLVVDGFETFEFSQYFPCHLNLAVGQISHFLYAFTDSELRRKGRMTEAQKRRRAKLEAELGRADPKSVEMEIAELLQLVPVKTDRVVLHTDDHRAYPRALRRIADRQFTHRVTSSLELRTKTNPLFAVNLLDLLFRHSSSNHKRETIAFSKRRQNMIEKAAVLQVWRNFVKSWSERKRDDPPAVRLGLIDRRLSLADILRQRLFPSRVKLPKRLFRYYLRDTFTRAIPSGRRHELKYAF